MYDVPSYVWGLVLVGAIGIPATTSIVLYRGGITVGLGRSTALGVAVATFAASGVWLLVTGYLASQFVYSGGRGAIWFGTAFTGVLAALLLATQIPPVARILNDPGAASRLAIPHTLRIAGVVFLVLMALGQLPAAFALPAGLGDMAIGVAAPFVARRLASEPNSSGAIAQATRFNLLGILDLVIAVSLGIALGPGLLLGGLPSTEPLRLLPAVLIPTAAVPLAVALHVVSLRRLSTMASAADTSVDRSWSSGREVPS